MPNWLACRLVGLSRDGYRIVPVASENTQAPEPKIAATPHACRRNCRNLADALTHEAEDIAVT